MIIHKFTATPWKTPIKEPDEPDFFEVEVLLYRQNQLLLILKNHNSNKKYSLQVNDKMHIRYIPQHFRFSIWTYPEWKKFVEDESFCYVLENSNFQQCIIGSKNKRNYLLTCEVEVLEILTNLEPLILDINDTKVDILLADFINAANVRHHENEKNFSNRIDEPKNEKNYSIFESILKKARLHFEFLIFSRLGANFIVKDRASKQNYSIKIPLLSGFQCVQSPDHGKDYSAINSLKNSVSPLWKLSSSQLLTETNDHNNYIDNDTFGSLYIKTDNVEIECITQDPPKISFENRQLLDLIREHLPQQQ